MWAIRGRKAPYRATLIGTGSVDDVPSVRAATSAVEMVVWPGDNADAGNGNVPCHWPGPVWPREIVTVPIDNLQDVALVVVIAATRTDVPFTTTVGDNVA